MQRRIAVGVIVSAVVFLAGVGVNRGPQAAQPGIVEQELLQLERDWCAAYLKKDAAILDRILADDYTGVGADGAPSTKSTALADLKSGTTTLTTCVDDNINVRVYGDAAVVTGHAVRAGTSKGTSFKDREALWTDTFVRRSGRWQCVASQSTLVPRKQK